MKQRDNMNLKEQKINNKDSKDWQNSSSSFVRSSNILKKNTNKHSITSVK